MDVKHLPVLAWCIVLFIFTCTYSLEEFLYNGRILFQWSGVPDFDEFWELPSTVTLSYIWRKFGHVFSFFVLTCLLKQSFKLISLVVVFGILFAVFTEISQLFLSRDGRLLDVLFDSTGVFVAVLLFTTVEVPNKAGNYQSKNSDKD